MINPDRLVASNKIIAEIAPTQTINLVAKNNRLFINYWIKDTEKLRFVMLDKGLFTFKCILPFDYPTERAIGLLVRWVRHEKHPDISLWRKWCKLGLKPESIIDILLNAGYPTGE
jgi:hypothetical protein